MAKHHVTTTINGDETEFLCETEQTLLDVLRDELHMTGTKAGRGTGACGTCSVTMDGRQVCSWLVFGAVSYTHPPLPTTCSVAIIVRT